MNTPIQYIPSHLIGAKTTSELLENENLVSENKALATNYYPNYAVDRASKPLEIEIIGGYETTNRLWWYVGGAVLLAYLLLKKQRKV
jgi:hypothetical protein